MYFGETHEEIYEGVKAMNKLANKVGKVLKILLLILVEVFGLPMSLMMFFAGEGMGNAIMLFIFFCVIGGVMAYAFGDFMGKNYAWGWIWYKQTHNTKNLGKDVVNTAAHNATVSYIIGGKGVAGWSLIGSLVTLMFTVLIGYWKGFYYRTKYEKLEKKLGKELGKI